MATPSLLMIPSGTKAGKLYSVLPEDGTGDFTVSRNSVANRVNSDGLLESMAVNVPRLDYSDGVCPALLTEPQSTNLITYPISFGNSYWTKSGASIEGDASTAGAEKVNNGDFATDLSGWSILNADETATIAWSSGALNLAVTSIGTDSGRPRIQG